MVVDYALDTRHHQRLQCPDLCDSLLLRHLRLLRSLHLSPKRHPGPNPPMGSSRRNLRLPEHHGRPAGPNEWMDLWRARKQQSLPALCSEVLG